MNILDDKGNQRKKVNTHSGKGEKADQSDVPPPRSDVQEVDDNWSEDLSLEECENGLLEVDKDRSQNLTLEESITSRSRVDDDWSDNIFQDVAGDLSEWSADVLHALNDVMSKFSFSSVQTPVAHDSSDDVPEAKVCATSDSSDDVPEAKVCATSDSSNDVTEAKVCATSDSSDGVPQAEVCDKSDSSTDVPQATVCATSDSSDDVLQATVCDKADSSDDILQATVCATSDCSDGIPSAFLCPMSNCSDGFSPSLCSDMSYCCDDILEATFCGMSSYNDDVPASSSCDMSYCSDDVLEDTVCATSSYSDGVPPSSSCDMSDCNVDVPQDVAPQSRKLQDETKVIDINFCRYEIGSQLGKGGFGTVYAATCLDDGHQVALKFVSNRNKKFFIIDGYSRPLPLEVALLILASQDPNVPEIVQLLDWHMEPDHYVLVLERPMPFEELTCFVLQQIVTMEEDVARVIMHQAIFAAQTCCRRGVLHRDIKMENLIINPETLEVKLIDFGCGDFLTKEAYTSYAGTRAYCPPEYLMTGKYHGEPATVWSLGILLFALLCGDFPKMQDLKKINSNTWAKDGLSKECCNIISCCLQIDPEQRIELEKLSLHNWLKTADKK